MGFKGSGAQRFLCKRLGIFGIQSLERFGVVGL